MSPTRRSLSVLLLVGLAACGLPGLPGQESSWNAAPGVHASPWGSALAVAQDDAEAEEGGGFLHGVLVYIPNRVLDVFDIVRARVRLGPGIAFGARATELADFYAGTYATIYVGLPGPRGRVFPRLPAGFESKSGVEVSAADVTVEAGLGPDYGLAEVGVGLQALIVGFDVGVEPWEILDLITGLVTVDIADDDF